MQSAYNIVDLVAAAVHESIHEIGDGANFSRSCSGASLAGSLANRTFNLSGGKFFIDKGRVRNLNLDVFGFNQTEMGMQVRNPCGLIHYVQCI